tara:strand:- start:1472 stop:1933 length:462 start_codon:yes stop_codon:yes gene_type:complete
MTSKELLQLHDDTCKSCRDIMLKKNNDYTGGKKATDIFANFNSSKILDIHPVQGLLLRVIDKVQRIRSFTNDKELSVPNETVEDACDDIVNYAILAKAMLLDERSQIERPVAKLPTGEEEIKAEKRMNVIGQNGNEGLHYNEEMYAVGEGDMP